MKKASCNPRRAIEACLTYPFQVFWCERRPSSRHQPCACERTGRQSQLLTRCIQDPPRLLQLPHTLKEHRQKDGPLEIQGRASVDRARVPPGAADELVEPRLLLGRELRPEPGVPLLERVEGEAGRWTGYPFGAAANA